MTAAAARVVLCLPLMWSGLTKVLDFSGGTAEMAASRAGAGCAVDARNDPRTSSADRCCDPDRWTWLGAGALGVFTALATVMAHRFWTLDGIERVRELNTFLEHLRSSPGSCSSPSSASSVLGRWLMAENQFFEHLGLIGGFLLVAWLDVRQAERDTPGQ